MTSMAFRVHGQEYGIDASKLTFEEGRAIEDRTGIALAQSIERKDLTFIQAMVWVAMRRTSPDLKFSDLDNMPISDVEFGETSDPSHPTED